MRRISSRISTRVATSYSRYCKAPANVALRPGVQPVSLDEVVEVPARCRASLFGVVGRGEADREEGGRIQVEGGVMPLGPFDQRALVVAAVDRGADDDGVVVLRCGLGLVPVELVQVDVRAVVLERRGDPCRDLGGVSVGAGVQNEDASHVISLSGRLCARSREIPQQDAAFYGPHEPAQWQPDID